MAHRHLWVFRIAERRLDLGHLGNQVLLSSDIYQKIIHICLAAHIVVPSKVQLGRECSSGAELGNPGSSDVDF
jgi:hypothetical protein